MCAYSKALLLVILCGTGCASTPVSAGARDPLAGCRFLGDVDGSESRPAHACRFHAIADLRQRAALLGANCATVDEVEVHDSSSRMFPPTARVRGRGFYCPPHIAATDECEPK